MNHSWAVAQILPPMMNEHVHTIMTKNPIYVGSNDSLELAYSIFLTKHIHNLPVVDNGILVGMITANNLWQQKESLEEMKSKKVSQLMTRRLAKLSPTDKIGTAAELLLDPRVFALPVVEENNRLVGIVTAFDILRYEFKKEYTMPILYKDVLESGYRIAI